MGWFVVKAGKTVGPFPEAEMVEAIASGLIVKGQQVREEGGNSWIPIEQDPTLGQLVPVKRTSQRPASGGAPWLTIAALACVLTLFAACALIFLELRTHDAMIARIDNVTKHVDGVLIQIRDANAPAQWVPENEVHNNCITDRTTVTCTFTNLSQRAVTTCTRGKLTQKGAPGVKLESVMICTGKLSPAESRVLTGPWLGGFADDICFKQNDFGKLLDWSKCTFDTEVVDLPMLQKVSALAATK